jgi:integrase/recombinase XerC
MAGSVRKHARDLSQKDIKRLLGYVSTEGRHRTRNRLIVLLSVYAGLRASEITNLRWRMVLNEDKVVGEVLKLENGAAKKLSGRLIPIKSELRNSLMENLAEMDNIETEGYILRSQQGGQLKPQSVINWFRGVYADLGLSGASSHSGRRYFVTIAARKIFEAGGSLRDVQDLAGHRSVATTQLYIARNSEAQRKVIELI